MPGPPFNLASSATLGDTPVPAGQSIGPWAINGVLYGISCLVNNFLVVRRSTDSGVSWQTLDFPSPNQPKYNSTINLSGSFSFCLTPSRKYLYCLWASNSALDPNGTGFNVTRQNLSLSRFNLDSTSPNFNTWDQLTAYTNLVAWTLPHEFLNPSDSRSWISDGCVPAQWFIAAVDDANVFAALTLLSGPVFKADGHTVDHYETTGAWANLSADVAATVFRNNAGTYQTFSPCLIDNILAFTGTGNVYIFSSVPAIPIGATSNPVPNPLGRRVDIVSGANVGFSTSLTDDIFVYDNGIGPSLGLSPPFVATQNYGGIPAGFIDSGGNELILYPEKNRSRLPYVSVLTNRVLTREQVSPTPVATIPATTSGVSVLYEGGMQCIQNLDGSVYCWFYGVKDNNNAGSPNPTVNLAIRNGPNNWTSTLYFTIISDKTKYDQYLSILTIPQGGGKYTWYVGIGDNTTISVYPLTATIVVPPSLACASGSASLGQLYSSSLIVSGGTAPFGYSVVAGSLPPGLSLNASTGLISGRPTVSGTYSYTAQVTDANALTATASCSIIVTGISAQMIFQGVRRVSGRKTSVGFAFNPKDYIYPKQVVFTTVGQAAPTSPSVTIYVSISNFDFDLYELRINYLGANGAQSLSVPLTKLLLYDMNKQQMSNLPVLDVFLNGAQQSKYKMGAFVPPLFYQKDSQIRVDVYNLILDPTILPVTMEMDFVGQQRIPC